MYSKYVDMRASLATYDAIPALARAVRCCLPGVSDVHTSPMSVLETARLRYHPRNLGVYIYIYFGMLNMGVRVPQ